MDVIENKVSSIGPDFGELVREDRLHRNIYVDQNIFDLEMQKIFGSTWVYVGHESEIANVGDYKATYIGLQPVILTRDEYGTIQVLVNRCPHRGSIVCRQEKGNSNFFRCPYHGWTFKNTGALTGAPKRQRYSPDFDLSELNLMHLPRVETYRGLIFASFNPDLEGIIDYLAQAREYVDRILDLSPTGEIDLSAGVDKNRYRGNWKLQMENGVDGYHAAFLHDSFWKILKTRSPKFKDQSNRAKGKGWVQAFDNGHALLAAEASDIGITNLHADYPEYAKQLEAKLGADGVRNSMGTMNVLIFPNLYFVEHQIRVIQPVSLAETNVFTYPYLLKGAPDELNERRLREHEEFYPATGFGAPDDYEAFRCVTEGMQAQSVPWLVLTRGIHDEKTLEDGSRLGEPSDETPQRGMYREYQRLMVQ